MPIEVSIVKPRDKARRITLTSSEAAVDFIKAVKLATGSLAGGSANAYAFAWQNPESVSILIIAIVLKVTAAGGATSIIDIGSAADATTHSDNLVDGGALDGTQ